MTWRAPWRRRTPRELAAGALVLAGLVLFVVLVYAVVVVVLGAALGLGSAPDLALSVLATAVVAVAFDPVQTRLEHLARRLVLGGSPTPYDVLRRVVSTVSGSYRSEEVPVRMAQVLAEGTGAAWSQVWLVTGGRTTLAATWPPGSTRPPGPDEPDPREDDMPGRRTLPVRHGGELLGALVLQEREHVPLTTVEERLFSGLAAQAGLVLHGVRLRSELEQRAVDLAERAAELRASRQRLVDLQDARRRSLERDIHDGAQQHLVALAVNLRLAHTVAGRSPDRARELLASQREATAAAVDTIVQLARGIYPPLLADGGLAVALGAAGDASGVPVEVTVHDERRHLPQVEAAAYFSALEALQNAAKHALPRRVRIDVRGGPVELVLTVEDDGRGFDPAATPAGAGLANIRDRVEAVGGTVRVESAPGRGTRITTVLPAPAAADGAA